MADSKTKQLQSDIMHRETNDSSSAFKGLFEVDDESFEKILITMLDEENVSMKTEIQRPLRMTQFEILSDLLKSEGLIESANLIDNFAHKYRINMVSNKRKSRQEIIQALTEGLKEERTAGEKLMSPKESE